MGMIALPAFQSRNRETFDSNEEYAIGTVTDFARFNLVIEKLLIPTQDIFMTFLN